MHFFQLKPLDHFVQSTRSWPAIILLVLAGCGGGGDGGGTSVSNPPASVVPLGRKIDYRVTDTDNSSNNYSWQLEFTVVTSSADGSYSQSVIGNGGNITINGTRYGTVNLVDSYNTQHELVSFALPAAPSTVTCTYDASVAKLPTNLPVGQAWPVTSSHRTCSDGTSASQTLQSGSVVGTESVSVPAGTFSATKVQYVEAITQTSAAGVISQLQHNFTAWFDAASGRRVQSTLDITYADAPGANGRLTNELQQLLTAP
jgi:hypothetical protein